ncbi:MAG: tetratricopeptide repeat protein [Acidobacteria bacterium]|nr:tetratricopeptide repeat protein [Acidobacteriota bacterium]
MRAQTRHQLKQDRFSKATLQVAEQTVHWSVEHKNKLIASSVALLLIIAAAFGAWYYIEQQDTKASVDFSKAVEVLDAPVRSAGTPSQPGSLSFASSAERATEARKLFQAVIDRYPHTRAADFAHYFLGVTAAELGDNAQSERELKAVASYHDADLSSLGKIALASLYSKTNRTPQAIEIYKHLIQRPTRTVGKSEAEIQLAETYRTAGLTAEAKKQYEQVQKEAPQSEAAQLASSKLQDLK